MAKTQKWTASTFVSLVHENLTEKGHKVKKSDLSWAVKDAFEAAVAAGARGMRVRFPEIGALAWRVSDVITSSPRLYGTPVITGAVGVKDRFGDSGAPWELVKEFEVSAEHIAQKAVELMDVKKAHSHVHEEHLSFV